MKYGFSILALRIINGITYSYTERSTQDWADNCTNDST